MGKNSKIEWTHHTLNLWWGCTKVHEGCDHCYAETFSKRVQPNDGIWGNDKPRKLIRSWKSNLFKYQAIAHDKNEIHRVFVGSMMDIFEKPMPLINHKFESINENTGNVRNEFFGLIEKCPNLMFLLLTKRPSNINKYIPEKWKTDPLMNVMFGTSPVNQKTAIKLIGQLSKVKGKRFVSIEPQLGFIDLLQTNETDWLIDLVDWVIVGGESGNNRREFNPDWAREIRGTCKLSGKPFFMKQWDKIKTIPDDLMIREFPEFHLV